MKVRKSSMLATTAAVGAAAALMLSTAATAAPLWPGGPDVPGVQLPSVPGIPSLKPAPPEKPNFSAPRVTPSEGAVVGVAQPIIINFNEPVTDHATAEKFIKITTAPHVDGAFHWFSDKQVRWRPQNLWPAHTQITVDAGDTHSAFSTGDAVVTTADDATHMITITRDGQVIKTMPTSMGKPGHETPNGIYTLSDRYADMTMDSSTYGVPVDSPQGYRVDVKYATRMSNDGIFVHGAPWSEWAQGNTDTSHGCLNVSIPNAQWFYENTRTGDPVIVKNSTGERHGLDGLTDFSMPWNQWSN